MGSKIVEGEVRPQEGSPISIAIAPIEQIIAQRFDHPLVTVDETVERFARFAREDNWHSLGQKFANQIMTRTCDAVGRQNAALRGSNAAEYLSTIICALTNEILAQSNRYGSARWLWYLRRLPHHIFQGELSSTWGYDASLTEALSFCSKAQEESLSTDRFAFRVHKSDFHHCIRFVAATKALSHLHSQYRKAGKGGVLNFSEVMPFCENTPEVQSCIELYDDRADTAGGIELAGLGLSNITNATDALTPSTPHFRSDIFLFRLCEGVWMPSYGPDGKGGFCRSAVFMRHALQSMPVDGILGPYEQSSFALPYLQQISPLLLLLNLFLTLSVEFPWALNAALQCGYFVVSESNFAQAFDRHAPTVIEYFSRSAPDVNWSRSYRQWHDDVAKIEPVLWPLRSGGVVRRGGGAIMIDLTAASRSLLQGLQIDRSAAGLANTRAATFELSIQKMIDTTPWKPPSPLANLRGLTLRRNRISLTDLDAIGSSDNVLLLVSCKSVIHDPEYDKGTYRVVRNLQSTVDEAVISWAKIISILRAEPSGDNYDFRQFKLILGVVCVPFVVYSSSNATLAFISGTLRASCSATELRQWLTSS